MIICGAEFDLGWFSDGRNSSSSLSKNIGVGVALLTMDFSVVASMGIQEKKVSDHHDFQGSGHGRS